VPWRHQKTTAASPAQRFFVRFSAIQTLRVRVSRNIDNRRFPKSDTLLDHFDPDTIKQLDSPEAVFDLRR
jgi:hypothetical protein